MPVSRMHAIPQQGWGRDVGGWPGAADSGRSVAAGGYGHHGVDLCGVHPPEVSPHAGEGEG